MLGFWINFFFQQTNCVKAALRMGEDHNGTTVVVVREILPPRVEHIEVRLVPSGRELCVARTKRSAESGRGNRAVDRGEHATHLVETCGLHDGGVDLSAGSEVAGHRGIFARGGIHVEAIDGRVNGHVGRIDGQRAIGGHSGDWITAVTHIVGDIAATDPARRVCIEGAVVWTWRNR